MDGRATRIRLFSVSTIPMRTFHLAWMAFFVCFFAWFAVAPLMPVIRGDLHLSKDEVANINIAAVGVTIFVRLIIGPLTDRFASVESTRRLSDQPTGRRSSRATRPIP